MRVAWRVTSISQRRWAAAAKAAAQYRRGAAASMAAAWQLNGVMAKSQPVMSKRCTMKRLKAQSSNEINGA
jgi:hypothetical protein